MREMKKRKNRELFMSKDRPGDLHEEKRKYEAPRILWTESLEARAVVCGKMSDYACAGMPIVT